MSRIGNRSLAIPEAVTVEVNGNVVTVKGSKGELNLTTSDLVTVEVKEGTVVVTRKNETIPARQMHGTTNANIRNMILGVSKGFSKSLEIVGVSAYSIQHKRLRSLEMDPPEREREERQRLLRLEGQQT